jgi:uncharacterized protein YdeI (YjbR/CyaY-like superfamily)
MKQVLKRPTFFRTPLAMRKWLVRNHAAIRELLVGFYKRDSGKHSISWPESVDEALCFGWIDGVRKRVDDLSYTIRFSPRRPKSIWSAVNIRRVKVLTHEGRMAPAGLRAFESRRENKSGIYSYEQRSATLVEPYLSTMQKNAVAWAYFDSRPPSFRKKMAWWVISAKQEETRRRRLQQLIDDCASDKPAFK